jgi:DNA-binding transcriptional ArsR family regulator
MNDAAFLACVRATADPTRFRMLLRLAAPRSVGDLAAAVGITSSAATFHLHRLVDGGLVALERRGRRTVVRRVERRWTAIVRAFGAAE